ncbi:hypothetical protein DUNSADRAFT_6636 [Dunaliella salina]|uniref:Encoded protein n=1 Tax=Dunaliella salina TaxID=3046 RepID=A0ABQ7GMY9_DUNSA|nr:hypothetical protein DUNSADRAFT_6636 [Dunaliella salina]|eukprot:KAF5835971.1 hypothetical protein DUNSADRAFT_6636 [Dunaliella salina]
MQKPTSGPSSTCAQPGGAVCVVVRDCLHEQPGALVELKMSRKMRVEQQQVGQDEQQPRSGHAGERVSLKVVLYPIDSAESEPCSFELTFTEGSRRRLRISNLKGKRIHEINASIKLQLPDMSLCTKLLAAVLALFAPPLAAATGRGIKQIQGSIPFDYEIASGGYMYSNANRGGATSYPASQPLAPSEGLFGPGFLGWLRGRQLQQVSVVTSNPTSVSSPVTVISPSTSLSKAGGFGGGFGPFGLFGRKK